MPRANLIVSFLSLIIAYTSIASGQEAAQPATPPAVGTGVGVSPAPASPHAALQDGSDPFGFANEQPAPRRVRDKLRCVPLSTDYIEEVLDAKLKSPLEFENQPLRDVVASIAKEYSLPIVIDMLKLDEFAISSDVNVTINVENISLRSALHLILHQPGLEDVTFAVLNEVLTITTKEHCADSLYVRVYPTEDFVYTNAPPMRGAISWADYSPLVHVITKSIAPETWTEGEISHIKPGILIVRQQYRVHVEIEKLLNELRQELRALEKEFGNEALQETGRFYDRSNPRPRNRNR